MRYSAQVAGRPAAIHRTSTMEYTAQALMAIALLRSLPNWERIAEIYGGIDDHLGDLAQDLSNHPWENLERD